MIYIIAISIAALAIGFAGFESAKWCAVNLDHRKNKTIFLFHFWHIVGVLFSTIGSGFLMLIFLALVLAVAAPLITNLLGISIMAGIVFTTAIASGWQAVKELDKLNLFRCTVFSAITAVCIVMGLILTTEAARIGSLL